VHKKTKKTVAIKKIIDAFQNLIDAKRTYRELNYLLQIEHPAIVRLDYLLSMAKRGGQQHPSTTRLAPPPQEIRGCNTDKLAEPSLIQHKHVYAVFEYVEMDLKMALKRCS
jgi:serine/threonine protein kinase